jgi:hypothetical protein
MIGTIILFVCMVSQPLFCKDVHVTGMSIRFLPGRFVHRCQAVGAMEAARWALKNPQWRIERWDCKSKLRIKI